MVTVFVSYAHEGGPHNGKTLELANRLRTNGVDASIDRYDPHPREGWPKWMEHQMESDYIIAVLSPKYVSEFRQDGDRPSGSRFEAALISSQLLRGGMDFSRLAIVVFNNWSDISIPTTLYACTRYYVDQPGGYEKLYAFLTSQSLVDKPPLGNVVALRPKLATYQSQPQCTFNGMCRLILPIVEDNKRIFDHFGPNSGASPRVDSKVVRHDLSMWRAQRPTLDGNNQKIKQILRENWHLIPACHSAIFERWISHIDAFALHLLDSSVDYREHQFPHEVNEIVRSNS